MNTGASRIAVVIPAYNASAYIEDAIKSVLAQSMPADEIVVVDDGSTDNTAEVVARVSARVVVLRQKNAGQGSARQHGVEATTADLLLFLDADDILHTFALEKLATALFSRPLAALAYGRAEIWSPTDQFPSHVDPSAAGSGEDLWGILLRGNFIRTPGCVLVRRSALTQVGGWDADVTLKGNEDWELWLRLAETSSFVFVPETLLKYRMVGTGFCSNRGKMYRSMFRLFGKQRMRSKQNADRRLAIAAGEWHNCRFVLNEVWHRAKLECSKGHIFRSGGLLLEGLHSCAVPATTHVLHVSRLRFIRWWFMLFRKEHRSHSA
jgi:glycosyltransferase involved in cell wall biosynthesis